MARRRNYQLWILVYPVLCSHLNYVSLINVNAKAGDINIGSSFDFVLLRYLHSRFSLSDVSSLGRKTEFSINFFPALSIMPIYVPYPSLLVHRSENQWALVLYNCHED